MKKIIFVSSVIALLGTNLFANNNFIQNIDYQIQNNKQLIQEYKHGILKLEVSDRYLLQQKRNHLQSYKQLPAFTQTKKEYTYRIALNGSKPNHINFRIKNNILTLSMNMQTKQRSKNSFFESSQYFYQSFTLPHNIKVQDITHKIVGDYFIIIVPKK